MKHMLLRTTAGTLPSESSACCWHGSCALPLECIRTRNAPRNLFMRNPGSTIDPTPLSTAPVRRKLESTSARPKRTSDPGKPTACERRPAVLLWVDSNPSKHLLKH